MHTCRQKTFSTLQYCLSFLTFCKSEYHFLFVNVQSVFLKYNFLLSFISFTHIYDPHFTKPIYTLHVEEAKLYNSSLKPVSKFSSRLKVQIAFKNIYDSKEIIHIFFLTIQSSQDSCKRFFFFLIF